MGEPGLGQGVEVGDLGVEFSAEAGAEFGRAFAVRAVRGARAEDFFSRSSNAVVVPTNLVGATVKFETECGVATLEKAGFLPVVKSRAIVVIDPEIMSGTPCFAGTRVPVQALLDYIEGGDTLDEFLDQYPTVARKQAVAFLKQSSDLLLASAAANR